MARKTRLFRRRLSRAGARLAWHRVRRSQVRRALRALEALYRGA